MFEYLQHNSNAKTERKKTKDEEKKTGRQSSRDFHALICGDMHT